MSGLVTPETNGGGDTRTVMTTGRKKRFTQTPLTRRLRVGVSSRRPRQDKSKKRGRGRARRADDDDDDEDEDAARMKPLTGKTWTLLKVSPLYGLGVTSRQLRDYGRSLAMFVDAWSRRGEGVGEDSLATTAHVRLCHALPHTHGEPPALEIILETKKPRGVVRCEAILVGEAGKRATPAGFSLYPLMLGRGPVSLRRLVNAWLERQFDCCVSGLRAESSDLASFLPLLLVLNTEKESEVRLTYATPKLVSPDLQKLTLALPHRQARDLWTAVYGEAEGEIVWGDYFQALHAHFYSIFKIDLQTLSLLRFQVPAVLLGGEGKLKLLSGSHVATVLELLTSLAGERLALDVMLPPYPDDVTTTPRRKVTS